MPIKSTFKVDLFDCKINILFCENVKKSVDRCLKRYGHKPLNVDINGFFFCPGAPSNEYFVFFDIKSISVDLVNHEKSHLVEEILIGKGIRAAGEIRAILDGFISTKIDNILKRRKIKL